MSDSINKILFRKTKSLLKIFFYEFFGVFILIIRFTLLFLQPFILVRVGFIQSSRIGGMSVFFSKLIFLKKIRKDNKGYYFLFYESHICNNSLKNLFEEESKKSISKFFFFNESMFSILLKYSYNKYNFGKSLIDLDSDNKNNQLYYLMRGKVNNFKLSLEDEKKGQRYIDRLNIPKNKKWICVHNRDSYYLEKSPIKINYKISTSDYFKYHSYRDFDINNLSKAVNLFNEQEYHVFRMGTLQANKMNYKNKNFTDYAFNSDKSDFNDIFLLSNCSAYLGSGAGLVTIPYIFGKPIYLINFSLSQIYLFHQDGEPTSLKIKNSFIFKHLFDRKRQRKLSLKEMFKSNLFKADRSEVFEKAGIDLIENTSEEIYDIANEVLENLNNKKENINDYDLQKKFWDIYYDNTNFKRYEDIPVKICSKFLLNNPYILE